MELQFLAGAGFSSPFGYSSPTEGDSEAPVRSGAARAALNILTLPTRLGY